MDEYDYGPVAESDGPPTERRPLLPNVALAVPHTPWVPERAASMLRLRDALQEGGGEGLRVYYREFTERKKINLWARDMWEWLAHQPVEWCVQLQDDVMIAPRFWDHLRAMLSALPDEAGIIGLASTHPMAPEMARRGHRWYRTPAMLVGWAWAIRRPVLRHFLSTLTDEPFKCEDAKMGQYAACYGHDVWHPCPTIVDHDTTIKSTYANDQHSTRRPQCTWRDYGEASMSDPSWWSPSGMPECLPMPPQRMCCLCLEHSEVMHSMKTNLGVCGVCIGNFIGLQFQPDIPTAE